MKFILGLVLGALIGFGVALWFQGEPPFAGSASTSAHGISLTLSDGFLTRTAAPAIVSRSNGALSNVKVTSAAGDTAFVEAKGHTAGVTVPVGVSFSPRASGATIVLDLRSVHLGPLPVPDVVIDPLVTVINNRIASVIDSSNYRIVGAGTTTTGVEIFVRRK
jgi:hypothetical protein